MFAKTFKTAAIALSLIATSLPALASGHRIHVEQYGWNNQIGGGQGLSLIHI